jgi:RNA polymerase sigma factor (sigma-70 family)
MAVDRKGLIDRLYGRYESRVRGFLYGRVRRREIANELAQEVFMRLLRSPDLTAIRNPEAYLITVASNLAKEQAQKERHERHALDVDDPSVQDQISAVTDYADELDTAERVRVLRQALTQLSSKCQDVIVLRTRYGLSYEEIAQHLEISTNMVKKYVGQAIAHCRRCATQRGNSDD